MKCVEKFCNPKRNSVIVACVVGLVGAIRARVASGQVMHFRRDCRVVVGKVKGGDSSSVVMNISNIPNSLASRAAEVALLAFVRIALITSTNQSVT